MLGLDIYLTLVPTLEFVTSDVLHLIDITGDGSQQACIAKTATRRFLKQLLELSVGISNEACSDAKKANDKSGSLKGIAIDLTDILPMGGARERLELTCFCSDCRGQLAALSKRGKNLVEAFETFPNPWNLALKPSKTGIRYISDLNWGVSADALVGRTKLQGFEEFFSKEDDLNEMARILIEYLHVRHRQIVDVVADLFSSAKHSSNAVGQKKLERIIILEGTSYDWTSGLFIEKADDPSVCDELWFDPTGKGLVTQRVPFRSYMWRRSRYLQDAFFALVAHAQDKARRTTTGLANMPIPVLQNEVELRRARAVSGRLHDRLDLFLLPEKTPDSKVGRIGFVGSNLSEEISQQIVSSMRIAESFIAKRGDEHELDRAALIEILSQIKKS